MRHLGLPAAYYLAYPFSGPPVAIEGFPLGSTCALGLSDCSSDSLPIGADQDVPAGLDRLQAATKCVTLGTILLAKSADLLSIEPGEAAQEPAAGGEESTQTKDFMRILCPKCKSRLNIRL